MSSLVCPVCQGALREVNREGVMIDMCTQCRGVWLDRGELERLATVLSRAQPGFFEPSPAPERERKEWRDRRRDDDDDDDRYRYSRDHRRSGFGRFMDLFD